MRELRIKLSAGSGPAYLRAASAVREAIRAGQARPGEWLPSTRELAAQWRVHRHTARAALDELVAEGWLESVLRRGYRVAREPVDRYFEAQAAGSHRRTEGGLLPIRVVRRARAALSDELRLHVDFRSGLSDLREFPLVEFKSHLHDSLRRLGASHLGYGDPRGHARLLASLGTYLRRARAITGKEILITHGSQEGIHLAAQLLLRPGDRVAVDALTYPPALDAFRLAGARPVAIGGDAEGMRTEELARRLCEGRIALIYVTPLHHYPTTATLSLERRSHLYALAARHRVPILEDDYDHEFHFRSRPIPPLASADPHGLVIYVSSFSKVLLPSLRVGFMAVRPDLLEPLIGLRKAATRQNDALMQDTVARWIDDGGLERHLRRMRRTCEERLSVMESGLASLREQGLALDWHSPGGGMALWLDTGVDSERLSRYAQGIGLGLDPEARFRIRTGSGTHVRLGFAKHRPAETREGLRLLKRAIEEANA